MNDLLDTTIASYGPFVTVILCVLLFIFAVTTVLLPLFVWGIHNQTKRAARELIRLNQRVERLRLQLSPHEPSAQQPAKDRRTAGRVEELFKRSRKEIPGKDTQQEAPAPTWKRRKVFTKPEDEIRDQGKRPAR